MAKRKQAITNYKVQVKKPIDIKMTPEGLSRLKEEQQELSKKRPGVLVRMVAAREQGDLSENAGFHAAKDELARIDHRLRELALISRFADVISAGGSSSVSAGSVVVVDDGSGEKEFKIVGKLEADPASGLISDESPIGRALLAKKVGDLVEVEIPDGRIRFKILSIKSFL